MEHISLLSSSQHSFFTAIQKNKAPPLPFRLSKKRTYRRTPRLRCQKMYVPGFGEASPEAKAAKHLHNFFTYVAVRIVTAQLESRATILRRIWS
ncbi:hypothetical protein Leryth_020810 [Lithospermum erythrorhizon]|nr:hypothetical protein Leryth_020810 [Lithospermum erythrorhizon]